MLWSSKGTASEDCAEYYLRLGTQGGQIAVARNYIREFMSTPSRCVMIYISWAINIQWH